MAKIVHNFMGFTAKTLDGRSPAPMNDQALGLAPGVYMGKIYLAGATPTIDVASVQQQCNCLPWGATILVDTEVLVQKMRVAGGPGGGWKPNPDRLPWQKEFKRLHDAIRSTERGRTCKIAWFHAGVSYLNADNGAVWLQAYRDSTDTLVEPFEGAPQGVLGLSDITVGRCYREYRDAGLDARCIGAIAADCRRLTPDKPIMALLQPRKSGADWANESATSRFDYLSQAQFATTLAATEGKFDVWGVWNSGHYGPQGWTVRDGNWYAVKAPGSSVVVGDEFTATNGWWQALAGWMRPPRVVSTMPVGQGGQHFSGGGRVR